MNQKEINLAILNGVVSGLTISLILGVVGYAVYQKVSQQLATAENTPVGSILASL